MCGEISSLLFQFSGLGDQTCVESVRVSKSWVFRARLYGLGFGIQSNVQCASVHTHMCGVKKKRPVAAVGVGIGRRGEAMELGLWSMDDGQNLRRRGQVGVMYRRSSNSAQSVIPISKLLKCPFTFSNLLISSFEIQISLASIKFNVCLMWPWHVVGDC